MGLPELAEEIERLRGENIAHHLVLRMLMWTRPDVRDVLTEEAERLRAGPLYADLPAVSRQALDSTLEGLLDEP